MSGFDFSNLTGSPSNYPAWNQNMKSYLKIQRVWLAVKGEDQPSFADPNKPTRQERLDHRDWENTRDSAAGIIFLSLDESQKDLVRECRDDPKEMWKKLKEIHERAKTGLRFTAYNSLLDIRKTENESLTNFMDRSSRIVALIKSYRPPDFTLAQLEEELVCIAIIRALPAEYSSLVNSLSLVDRLSLDSLRAAFQQEGHMYEPRIGK